MSLNNSQYDTLIRQYNARQFHNQHLLDERIQEVYGKCPRLTEIDNEISSISVASAKQLLSDDGAEDSSVLSSLKEQLAALRREKQNLIASLGYPADYLEPVTPVRTERIPVILGMNAVIVLYRLPLI